MSDVPPVSDVGTRADDRRANDNVEERRMTTVSGGDAKDSMKMRAVTGA
jgi:hypothetical protein